MAAGRSQKPHRLNLQPDCFDSRGQFAGVHRSFLGAELLHEPARFVESGGQFREPADALARGIFITNSNHAYPRP